MEDSRSVKEFQTLGGTFGYFELLGGLVYGGYGPAVQCEEEHQRMRRSSHHSTHAHPLQHTLFSAHSTHLLCFNLFMYY